MTPQFAEAVNEEMEEHANGGPGAHPGVQRLHGNPKVRKNERREKRKRIEDGSRKKAGICLCGVLVCGVGWLG